MADTLNDCIRKVLPDGTVTTIPTEETRVDRPTGVAVGRDGNVYVGSWGTIWRVAPDGAVTRLSNKLPGRTEGIGSATRFSQPVGVALDDQGNLYAADYHNNRIIKGTPILVPEPRFENLSFDGGTLATQVSGLVEGWTITIESSTNLRDWTPIEDAVATGNTLTVNHPINATAGLEFFRASATQP